jgi:hypothetical protein
MKAFKKIMITVFSLLIPFLLQAAEFQVKVIKSEDDLPDYLKNFAATGKRETFLSLTEKT